MISLQLPSGNFPSSFGSTSDKLLQFCHGAGGAIPFTLTAYNLFHDPSFLQAALKAGEDLWNRGILLKGNGLCHGITGNAYMLHSFYRETHDEKWKYRCLMFADASINEEIQAIVRENEDDEMRKVPGIPDTPYSLMEGMSGNAVFYADVLMGDQTMRFPGYEI